VPAQRAHQQVVVEAEEAAAAAAAKWNQRTVLLCILKQELPVTILAEVDLGRLGTNVGIPNQASRMVLHDVTFHFIHSAEEGADPLSVAGISELKISDWGFFGLSADTLLFEVFEHPVRIKRSRFLYFINVLPRFAVLVANITRKVRASVV
jgi:hypothetical protein